MLRTSAGERHAFVELGDQAVRLRDRLIQLERKGALVLSDSVRELPIEDLLAEGVDTLSQYHLRPTVERDEKGLYLRDPKMAFYYGNRLESWAADLRESMG